MFLTEISESDILTIYDIVKFKCRTFIESVNILFTMGSELEQEVDTIETSVGTSADEASSSGSLWARIKYALANMVSTSGAQTITDVKTFSSSPVVPTTPGTTTSAVNQAYVESTVDGVNDILHKSGNESFTGQKTHTGTAHPFVIEANGSNNNSIVFNKASGNSNEEFIQYNDINSLKALSFQIQDYINGLRNSIIIRKPASDDDTITLQGNLELYLTSERITLQLVYTDGTLRKSVKIAEILRSELQ